jgi:hypothetical protein
MAQKSYIPSHLSTSCDSNSDEDNSDEGGESSSDEVSSSGFSDAIAGYLTPSTIGLTIFGNTTVLKYMDRDDRKTIVKKSSKSGGHAEEQMLSYIYRKGLIRMPKHAHYTLKEFEYSHRIALIRPEKTRETRFQLHKDEIARQKHAKSDIELNKRKQMLDEVEQEIKQLKKVVENIHTAQKHLEEGKELKISNPLLMKIVKNYLRESGSFCIPISRECSQQLKKHLPEKFWVSKSPCPQCSDMLIRAYEGRSKPTICISGIYKGKVQNLERLLEESFKFEQWDLYKEYKQWKILFEESDRYKKYQEHYDRTRTKLREKNISLPE